MKHSYFYSFVCSILLLAACSGEKAAGDKLPIINIDESTGNFENDYTSEAYTALLKSPKTLQLETKDECLLGGFASICDVTPKYIVVGGDKKIYFFDAHNGTFLSKIDRQGDGPEEYTDIYYSYFDEENELVYIATLKKIKSYKPDGTFVKEYPKDSFTNLAHTTDGYWGIYEREYWKQHLIALLDKDWKVKQSFLPDREAAFMNGDLFIPPRFREANNHIYTMVDDTLYTNKEDKLFPALVINKGKLKMPNEIIGVLDRLVSEGQKYIQMDAALIVGNLMFYNFFLERGRHYTVWDIKTGELLTHSKNGYFMPLDEKTTVNAQFSLIKNDKGYALLSTNELAKYGLRDDEDDSNPLLLCVDFENYHIN